jgi:hypothetical protein
MAFVAMLDEERADFLLEEFYPRLVGAQRRGKQRDCDKGQKGNPIHARFPAR